MSDTNKTREAQLAEEKAAKTAEELLAYASEAEVELSDEDLERVSGGYEDNQLFCYKCGGTNLEFRPGQYYEWYCRACESETYI